VRWEKSNLLIIMPFPYREETKFINDEVRAAADGAFIALPHGFTHYELSNPESSETVVLIHGFSVPYFLFDTTFDFLTQEGFRSLRFDLFGRGYSDRPRTRYNMDIFVEQLSNLLRSLRIDSPIHLIGLSMGGPIAAAFTAQNPEQVRSLVLIDPCGAKPIELSPLLKLVKVPILAELIFGSMGTEKMIEAIGKDFYDPKHISLFIEKYRVQMQYSGFQRALLSSVRNNMLGSFLPIYKQLGFIDKPVLMFWGRNDNTVPIEHSKDLVAAMPQAQLKVIENCGHIPHYEKPEVVNPILFEFLKYHDS